MFSSMVVGGKFVDSNVGGTGGGGVARGPGAAGVGFASACSGLESAVACEGLGLGWARDRFSGLRAELDGEENQACRMGEGCRYEKMKVTIKTVSATPSSNQ